MTILLNGTPIDRTPFPDRTSQVWKVNGICKDNNVVTWWFESEHELFMLHQLNMLLVHECSNNSLQMPYLPFARQDKYPNNDETFALYSFSSIINNMQWKEVTAFDVHSDVPCQIIAGFKNIPPHITSFIESYDYILLPDSGAYERYAETAQLDCEQSNILVGEKERDPSTGWILGYSLVKMPEEGIDGKSILVVDDLCDGGGTFKILAQSIKQVGSPSVLDLYVTHGLFSKGFGELMELYNTIHTTDSTFGYNLDTTNRHRLRQQGVWWNEFFKYYDNGRLIVRRNPYVC